MGVLSRIALTWAKQKAHKSFDRLWKEGYMTRSEAYEWISQKMGKNIHITDCSIKECDEVTRCSEELYAKLKDVY